MLTREELLNAVNWNYKDWYNRGKTIDSKYISYLEKSFLVNITNFDKKNIDIELLFIGFYEGVIFAWRVSNLDIRKEISKIAEENFHGFFDAFVERSPLFASLI